MSPVSFARRLPLAAAAAGAVLVLAACSSSPAPGPAASGSVPAPGPSGSPAPSGSSAPVPDEVPDQVWDVAQAMSQEVAAAAAVDVDALLALVEALPVTLTAEGKEPYETFFLLDAPSDGGEGPAPGVPPAAVEIRGFGSPDAVYCLVRPLPDGRYVAVAAGCEPLLDSQDADAAVRLANAAASGVLREVGATLPLPWSDTFRLKSQLVAAGALGYDAATGSFAVATFSGLYAVPLDPVTGKVSGPPVPVEAFPPAAS